MTNEWRDLPTMAAVSAAQAAGDEIEIFDPALDKWEKWNASAWFYSADYRARPAQPKMKKVKILGWVNLMSGATMTTGSIPYVLEGSDWIRYPNLDDEIEVPE